MNHYQNFYKIIKMQEKIHPLTLILVITYLFRTFHILWLFWYFSVFHKSSIFTLEDKRPIYTIHPLIFVIQLTEVYKLYPCNY